MMYDHVVSEEGFLFQDFLWVYLLWMYLVWIYVLWMYLVWRGIFDFAPCSQLFALFTCKICKNVRREILVTLLRYHVLSAGVL